MGRGEGGGEFSISHREKYAYLGIEVRDHFDSLKYPL